MIKRIRTFYVRLLFTADFLWSWGERVTPGSLRFVWKFCEKDFNQALMRAIEAGEIPADRYYVNIQT